MAYLVCERDEYCKHINIQTPVVLQLYLTHWRVGELVRLIGQYGHDYGEIVAVGLDKIVSSDCRWVDVMFAEITK